MIDYFSLYNEVLATIATKHPRDAFQLFEQLSNNTNIQTMRKNDRSNLLPQATIEVLDNLIDEGLVIAKRIPTKDVTLYQFERISTIGHTYLATIQKPNFKEKCISYIKSEGIPLTPSAITKFIARMTL